MKLLLLVTLGVLFIRVLFTRALFTCTVHLREHFSPGHLHRAYTSRGYCSWSIVHLREHCSSEDSSTRQTLPTKDHLSGKGFGAPFHIRVYPSITYTQEVNLIIKTLGVHGQGYNMGEINTVKHCHVKAICCHSRKG